MTPTKFAVTSMDWESYRRLGPGTAFDDKPGRSAGGSGWHWNTLHKPPQPDGGRSSREQRVAAHKAERAAVAVGEAVILLTSPIHHY